MAAVGLPVNQPRGLSTRDMLRARLVVLGTNMDRLPALIAHVACTGQLYERHHRVTKSIVGIPIEVTRQDLPLLTGELFAECGVAIALVAHRRIVVEQGGRQILETDTD